MIRRAELAEPSRAVAGDQRHVGEGLDVRDERRAPAEAALVGPRRRQGRLHRAAVEGSDQRRLLAGEVRVRDDLHAHASPRRRRSASARLTAACAAAVERFIARTISRAPTASAASSAPSSTRCGASSSSVRSLALSGSPSAALTTIARRPRRGGDGPQLDRGGERGAAAAAQTRGRHLVDQGRSPVAGIRDGSVAAGVLVERERARVVAAGEQPREPAHPLASVTGLPVTVPEASVSPSSKVHAQPLGAAVRGAHERLQRRALQRDDPALELAGAARRTRA